MLLENYTGDSKVLKAIAHILNRKAPLPLDGDGDADFGTNGQVLTTDGSGTTSWTTPSSGGDSVEWTQIQASGTKIAEIEINGTSQDVYAPNGGGGGGGHTIEDADGTDLTQRNTLQFAGYLKADDDSVNSKTVVDDSPTEVTWATWQTMTDAQKAGTKWLITGAPDTDVDASDVTYGSDTVGGILDGRRVRHNITTRITNLSQAVSEQNLEKYGYTIGDYFVGASGYEYILAQLNLYYGGFDSNATIATNHIGILVNTKATTKWGDSITANGYSASTLHTFLTGTVLTNIQSDFTALFGDYASHLVSNNRLYNKVGGWAWGSTQYISALTEMQLYGCPMWSIDKFQQGEGIRQIEIFRKYSYQELFGNNVVWLRSIYQNSGSYAQVCVALSDSLAYYTDVTSLRLAVGLILFK